MQKRAYIYCRVASPHNHIAELETQRSMLREHANAMGFEVVDTASEQASGRKTDNRPGLAAVLKAAEAKEFDILLVSSLDRLGRGEALVSLINTFQEKGIDIYQALSCEQNIGPQDYARPKCLQSFEPEW